MKTGLSLNALAAKITARQELKHDLIIDTRQSEMVIQDDGVAALNVAGGGIAAGPFPILGTAHDQIGARLQIPSRYYDRMLAEQPSLLATNVNAWFHSNPERRMLRTLGGDARAFLSDRYQRIDDVEIAEVVLPILAGIPDVQIVSCEVTERRLYIQAVSPRVQGEVAVGDAVQAGVVISNSEIGHGAVSVASLIYRLKCKNGMIAADKFRAYHVGRLAADSEALWADDTRRADDRAILLKVRDMVRLAVDETAFRGRIEQMAGLTTQQVTGDPAKAVEVLAKTIGATDAERGGILTALIRGGDLSAWGLLNAVTAQAHDVESYDRAVEFEAAGGQLLVLPQGEWKRILTAA